MSEDVYIHAGGPRTGSSTFQTFLELNRDAIKAQGVDVDFPNRDAAKSGRLRLRLPAPRHGPNEDATRKKLARRNLSHRLRPGRPFLISEENIAGRMMHFRQGQFFPIAERRAAFLAEVLAPQQVARVLLVVRPYAGLFTSAHRKRAEENRVQPFSEIAEVMAGFNGGWPETVAALRDGLRPKEFIVLRHRRRPQAELASIVCPELNPSELAEPKASANVSLSDAGVFAIQARLADGAKAGDALTAEVRAEFADVKAPEPFAAFSDAQADRLGERYQDDLERLAGMDGVAFLDDG